MSDQQDAQDFADITDAYNRERTSNERIRAAAKALYVAGRWDCAAVPADEACRLWEALRDAAGIAPGTATAAGMSGATVSSSAAHPIDR